MSGRLALIGLTGSRLWPDPQLLENTLCLVWHDALEVGYTGIELMHGCAEGADTIGHEWAFRTGFLIREFPADWNGPCGPECPAGHRRRNRRGNEYCPLAGHRRNQRMVDERPVLFVAAHHQGSAGTADCIRRAERAGIPVWRLP
ncbi:SLOG family protein [Streptomyces kaempferi]|uniref:SLOG family protein n=1 Tax=Streptomyces kaempferi TaxID=333725 RepID=A0ABW3XHZ2_9ACTN